MKTVILAGGFGTRLSEETGVRPKPLVEIGGMPIIWHIMKMYSHYGHNEFIICCGYKGHMIKEFFSDYFLRHSDVTFDIKNNKMKIPFLWLLLYQKWDLNMFILLLCFCFFYCICISF